MSRRIAVRWLVVCAALAVAPPAAAQQPVSSWRLDDGAGRVAVDDGPFGLDAVWPSVGGPAWIPGVSGTALRFTGDGELAVADDAALEPTRITVAAWVRRAGSPGNYLYVFSKGGTLCLRSAYGLYTGPDGGAAFYVSGGGSYTLAPQAPPGAVWDGRWHRLAGTYDGTRVRLYLDGVQVGGGTPGPTHIEYGLASREPSIGGYLGSCRQPFDGDIDGVTVWNRALAATAIAADAQPPAETPSTAPIGPAPGAPVFDGPGSGAGPGFTATLPGCTSVAVSRRVVRAARRTSFVVTVLRGNARRAGVRVVVRARRLRKARRTNGRGRVRFVVRAHRAARRLTVKAAATGPAACGSPKAYIRVRKAP